MVGDTLSVDGVINAVIRSQGSGDNYGAQMEQDGGDDDDGGQHGNARVDDLLRFGRMTSLAARGFCPATRKSAKWP